jgi:hypothetical protein
VRSTPRRKANININVMTTRQNTAVCAFETSSPRINAHDIHEWIFTTLRLPENDIISLQIDAIKSYVYIKMTNYDKLTDLLNSTKGQVEFKHHNGEISQVQITEVNMGRKRVILANLPPEVHNSAIHKVLAPFGQIAEIKNEKLFSTY